MYWTLTNPRRINQTCHLILRQKLLKNSGVNQLHTVVQCAMQSLIQLAENPGHRVDGTVHTHANAW